MSTILATQTTTKYSRTYEQLTTEIRIPDASHNPGLRFIARIFSSHEDLAAWSGPANPCSRDEDAVGTLSAQGSVIARQPISRPEEITLHVGDTFTTSEGTYKIVDRRGSLYDPYLVKVA